MMIKIKEESTSNTRFDSDDVTLISVGEFSFFFKKVRETEEKNCVVRDVCCCWWWWRRVVFVFCDTAT